MLSKHQSVIATHTVNTIVSKYDSHQNPDFFYLYSRFWQVDLQRHFLPHEDVRVSSFLEEGLQNVELGPGKGGPLPALFPWVGR